jgi:hypothetical protein
MHKTEFCGFTDINKGIRAYVILEREGNDRIIDSDTRIRFQLVS